MSNHAAIVCFNSLLLGFKQTMGYVLGELWDTSEQTIGYNTGIFKWVHFEWTMAYILSELWDTVEWTMGYDTEYLNAVHFEWTMGYNWVNHEK